MRYRTYNPFLSCIGGLCGYQNLGIEETTDATAELRKETGLPASDQTSESGHSVIEQATPRPSGVMEMPLVMGVKNYFLPKQIAMTYTPTQQLMSEITAYANLIFDAEGKVRTLTSDQNILTTWESMMQRYGIKATEWVAVAENALKIMRAYNKPAVPSKPKEEADDYVVEAYYVIQENVFVEEDEGKWIKIELPYETEAGEAIWIEWDENKQAGTHLVDPAEVDWEADQNGAIILKGHDAKYIKNRLADVPGLSTNGALKKKPAAKIIPKPKTSPKKKGGLPNWPLYLLGGIGLGVLGLFLYRRFFKTTPEKRTKNPKKGCRKPNSMTRYRISARKATKG